MHNTLQLNRTEVSLSKTFQDWLSKDDVQLELTGLEHWYR
jgi:hypothetical protein